MIEQNWPKWNYEKTETNRVKRIRNRQRQERRRMAEGRATASPDFPVQRGDMTSGNHKCPKRYVSTFAFDQRLINYKLLDRTNSYPINCAGPIHRPHSSADTPGLRVQDGRKKVCPAPKPLQDFRCRNCFGECGQSRYSGLRFRRGRFSRYTLVSSSETTSAYFC